MLMAAMIALPAESLRPPNHVPSVNSKIHQTAVNLTSEPCVDPQAWLADVLSRIAETRQQSRLCELPPWKWTAARLARAA